MDNFLNTLPSPVRKTLSQMGKVLNPFDIYVAIELLVPKKIPHRAVKERLPTEF